MRKRRDKNKQGKKADSVADCALLEPGLALAQGNWGLFLLERGEREAARARLRAAAADSPHWSRVRADDGI